MHEAGHAVIGRTLGIKVASAEIFLRSGVYSSTNLLAAARLADCGGIGVLPQAKNDPQSRVSPDI